MKHSCTECDWYTEDPVKRIAEARATYHVYRKRPERWREVVGDRPPLDPDPDTPDGFASLAGITGTN